VPADGSPAKRARRGFVIGELLVALLLLAVAVSSLAALMYSVSRRPTASAETECSASAAATGKCVPSASAAGGPSKLLRSGCATRSVYDQRGCKDTVVTGDASSGTVVKARTDSVAMAMLAKKQKAQQATERPDRGFIR
jgi:Tfp pilus assembly protein PilV